MSGRTLLTITLVVCGVLMHGCGKDPESSNDPGSSEHPQWELLGQGVSGGLTVVRTLAVHEGDLYAGGTFSRAGEIQTHGVARWDGVSWSSLGPGLWSNPGTVADGVYALQVFRGQLYAGGLFGAYNDMNGLARWDGTSWQPVPGWTNGSVFALGVYNGMLAVSANVGSARAVTLTDGDGTWQPIAAPDQAPSDLVVWRGDLVAIGCFTRVNSEVMTPPARWDGASWHSCAPSVSSALTTSSAAVYQSDLLCAPLRIDGYSCSTLRWNGESWSCVDSGVRYLGVNFLRVCDGRLYEGGLVTYPETVGSIAVFEEDGRATPLGRTDRGIYERPIWDVIMYDDHLVVAGAFSQIDGVTAGCIAMCKIK